MFKHWNSMCFQFHFYNKKKSSNHHRIRNAIHISRTLRTRRSECFCSFYELCLTLGCPFLKKLRDCTPYSAKTQVQPCRGGRGKVGRGKGSRLMVQVLFADIFPKSSVNHDVGNTPYLQVIVPPCTLHWRVQVRAKPSASQNT